MYFTVSVIFIVKKLRGKILVNWYKEVARIIFGVYMCEVIFVTLFPLYLLRNGPPDYFMNRINWVPLISIIDDIKQVGTAYDGDSAFMISLIVRNVGGNILLLMPLGFLAPIAWSKMKSFRNLFLHSLFVSGSIELLQFFESFLTDIGRVTDIDDLIFNVSGALVGFLIYFILALMSKKIGIKGKQQANGQMET